METTGSTTDTPRVPTTPIEAEHALPSIREHIVRTPETCAGKPRIAGTRIKVEQVAIWHERMGMRPEEISARWPHLTLADIHAALAYYHDHRGEIDHDLAEGDRLFEELKARRPSILERTKAARRVAPGQEGA